MAPSALAGVIDVPTVALLITGLVRVLLVRVSVAVINETVPVASGNVIVLSAVGSVIAKVVSKPLAVPPSNVRGLAPCNVAPIVSVSAAASPRTRLPFRVVVPPTVRAPVSVIAAVLNSPVEGLYVSPVSVSAFCSPVAPSTKIG